MILCVCVGTPTSPNIIEAAGRSGPAGLVSDWATGRPVLLYTALRFSPKRVFQKIDARTRREGVREVLVRRRSSCQRVVKGAGRENKTLWNLD